MLLPLFPLNTVLFPGMVMPLHIFEQRYRTMIGRCIEEQSPFGVVLIREGVEVGAQHLHRRQHQALDRVGDVMALVEHMRRIEVGRLAVFGIDQLVEDQEQPVGLDGARIDFGDGAWAGIRQSNTSPCLSICIEARSPEKLKEVEEIVLAELKKHPEIEL